MKCLPQEVEPLVVAPLRSERVDDRPELVTVFSRGHRNVGGFLPVGARLDFQRQLVGLRGIGLLRPLEQAADDGERGISRNGPVWSRQS